MDVEKYSKEYQNSSQRDKLQWLKGRSQVKLFEECVTKLIQEWNEEMS
jgi:hypothetical protein